MAHYWISLVCIRFATYIQHTCSHRPCSHRPHSHSISLTHTHTHTHTHTLLHLTRSKLVPWSQCWRDVYNEDDEAALHLLQMHPHRISPRSCGHPPCDTPWMPEPEYFHMSNSSFLMSSGFLRLWTSTTYDALWVTAVGFTTYFALIWLK